MLIEMHVIGLTMDSKSQTPVLILREANGERFLPIWIGMLEASAIALELDNITLNRPLTHDLFKTVLTKLSVPLIRTSIVDLSDNTYYAEMTFEQGGQLLHIDARPSDAIAMALRFSAPIYCDEEVLSKAHIKASHIVGGSEQHTSESDDDLPAGEDDLAGDDVFASAKDDGPQAMLKVKSLSSDDKQLRDLLQNLDPKAFGKYKM